MYRLVHTTVSFGQLSLSPRTWLRPTLARSSLCRHSQGDRMCSGFQLREECDDLKLNSQPIPPAHRSGGRTVPTRQISLRWILGSELQCLHRANQHTQGTVDAVGRAWQPRKGSVHLQAVGWAHGDASATTRAACFIEQQEFHEVEPQREPSSVG